MSEWGRKDGSFLAEDPSGRRYLITVYEMARQNLPFEHTPNWRPILRRTFVTSDEQVLQQLSSDTFRILPDGPDLKAVPWRAGGSGAADVGSAADAEPDR
jgi:hypothetical protein